VHAALEPAWAAQVLRETDATADRPGDARLELVLQGDGTVLVRGRLNLAYSVPCARCLAPASVDADARLCITAVPAARLRAEMEAAWRASPDPDGVEIESEALDQVGYDGHELDLGRILGEQVLLAYPIRALCGLSEACRGLCSGCGADLNQDLSARRSCPRCDAAAESAKGAGEDEPVAAWKQQLRKLTRS
jgi:uncharacterized protein